MINFEALKQNIENDKNRQARGNFVDDRMKNIKLESKGYKIFIPTKETTAKLRILVNNATNLISRYIPRHTYIYNDRGFKANVPCLRIYNQECPICTVSKNIRDIHGNNLESFKHDLIFSGKYVSFALIEEISGNPPSALNDDKPILPGEVVLFFHSKTIEGIITNTFEECANEQEAGRIFEQNVGKSFVIKPGSSQQGAGSIMFSLSSRDSEPYFKEADGDIRYKEMVNSLPSLYDVMVSPECTEEIQEASRDIAAALSKKYLSDNAPESVTAKNIQEAAKATQVVNAITNPQPVVPQPVAQPAPVQPTTTIPQPAFVSPIQPVAPVQPTTTIPQQPVAQQIIQPVVPQPVAQPAPVQPTTTIPQQPVSNSGDRPSCFGNYSEIDAKCILCPHSNDCITSKQ